MGISEELRQVYNTASKIYYAQNNVDIDCMNLLLSMAISKGCLAHQILSSKGLNAEVAQSFVTDKQNYHRRNISPTAERAILRARDIAIGSDYNMTYSPHLLLAVTEYAPREVTQALKDYDIKTADIAQVIASIHDNKIGESIDKKVNSTIINNKIDNATGDNIDNKIDNATANITDNTIDNTINNINKSANNHKDKSLHKSIKVSTDISNKHLQSQILRLLRSKN